jgi:D-alanyl-D-alanine carboxypeptidase/D-alanyl-D-alanine-endopeptidase (penicillin-binding protein 4)
METPGSWFPPESKESSVKFLPRVVATPRAVVAVAAALAATAGLLSQSAGAPAAVQATGLQQQLDTLLTDARFTGSQVGLVVRDATSGETLYDRNGSTRLLPASDTKLFSSTAAMHTLGAGFRFHTNP